MSFPRYERYKDSGVAWLGEVPEHWSILPLLAVGRERDQKNTGMAESNLLSLSYGRIIRKDIDTNEGLLPESFETYQIVHPGDIVFRLTDLQNDKRSLRTAIVEERGIITSAYLALKPFSANPQFLNYLLRAYDLRKVFYAMGSGVRQSMNYEDVKRMEMLLPSVEEQAGIVAFLNRETAKIDALIEEQRRLVALLKEKRQAVISHAVTKGLNPSAPMKESGIEWLGRIPSHWDMAPLGYLARIETGGRDTENADADGQYPFFVRSQIVERINSYSFDGEGILTAGDGAGVGKVFHHFTGRFDFHQRVYLISHFQRVLGSYLFNYFKENFYKVALEGGAKSTVDSLRRKNFTSFPVPIPPHSEQSAIVKYVERLIARYDNLALEAEKAVQVLQERRSALISAAVTGKINVATQVAKPVRSTWSTALARQVLAAETLSRCNGPSMGRVKLQKLIHLCEHHAQLDEVRGTYSRQAAGPFAPQVMEDVREGLLQQRWFEEYRDGDRYAYRELEKAGEHRQYLAHWEDKQAKIDQVLNLLGGELTRKCEIVSTLYAAWNDLLIDGKSPTDAEIIHEASSAERWHESKEKIATEKWPETLKLMRANGLVPVGYGTHTTHQPDLFPREGHEPA